jgi:hypothetical protein
MTAYEQRECLAYKTLFFLGPSAQKTQASLEAGNNNHGYIPVLSFVIREVSSFFASAHVSFPCRLSLFPPSLSPHVCASVGPGFLSPCLPLALCVYVRVWVGVFVCAYV